MSGFAADWLALRAPADTRARNPAVAAAVRAHFAGHPGATVLDLGAGTGATLHAVGPLLPVPQTWRLADDDPALLARVEPPEGASVEALAVDLADDPGPLLDPAPDLVAASAFFDLCSAAWIDRLVARLEAARVPLYAALTYDGRERWQPPHRLDPLALTAFHADQRRDKGLGPALGPEAHAHLARRLTAAGFAVTEGTSDWHLEAPRDARLIAALAQGTAGAVRGALGAEADEWLDARMMAEGAMIGHRDLFAVPA